MLSPGFFDQPEQKQIEALGAVHPGFQSWGLEKQRKILAASRGLVQHPAVQAAGQPGPSTPAAPGYWDQIKAGAASGMASVEKIAGNVLGLLGPNQPAQTGMPAPPLDETYTGGMIQPPAGGPPIPPMYPLAAKRKEHEAYAASIPEGKTLGVQLARKIPEVAISSVPQLLTRGNPLGMAAVGAAENMDRGVIPAAQGAVTGYAYGRAIPGIMGKSEKYLGRVMPTAYAGPVGLGAAQAAYGAVMGQSPGEIIANALEGAALGGVSASRARGKAATKAAQSKTKAAAAPAPEVTTAAPTTAPPAVAPEATAPPPPTPVGVPPEVAPAVTPAPAAPAPIVSRSTVEVGGQPRGVFEVTRPAQAEKVIQRKAQQAEYQRKLAASKVPDVPAPAQGVEPLGPMSEQQIEQRIGQLQQEQAGLPGSARNVPGYQTLQGQRARVGSPATPRAQAIEQEIQSLQTQQRQMNPELAAQHQAYLDKLKFDIKWISDLRDGMKPTDPNYGEYTDWVKEKQTELAAADRTMKAVTPPVAGPQPAPPPSPAPASEPTPTGMAGFRPSLPTPSDRVPPMSAAAGESGPARGTPQLPGASALPAAAAPPPTPTGEPVPTGMAGFRPNLPAPAAGSPVPVSNPGTIAAMAPPLPRIPASLETPPRAAAPLPPPLPEGAPPAVDLSVLDPSNLVQSAGLTPPTNEHPPQAFSDFISKARAAFQEKAAGLPDTDPQAQGALVGAQEKLNQYLKPYEDLVASRAGTGAGASPGASPGGPAPTPQMQTYAGEILGTIRSKVFNAKDVKVTLMDANGKPLGSQEFPIDTSPAALAQAIAAVPGAQRVQYGPGSQTEPNIKGTYYKFLDAPAAGPPPGPVGPR